MREQVDQVGFGVVAELAAVFHHREEVGQAGAGVGVAGGVLVVAGFFVR